MTSASVLYALSAIWLLSLAGTGLALKVLAKYHVMDVPGERSNHNRVTPRGGGIAMIAVTLAFLYAYGLDARIVVAALLLASVSFADDLGGLPVRVRLLVQAAAVIAAVQALPVHGVVALVALAFLWLWYINLTNFMDGIDGITSMQVIMTCIGICCVVAVNRSLTGELALYAAFIAASALGFFWFNRHPARLFMGDIGSVTLGFLLFYLLASLAFAGQAYAALVLPAYYVCDATVTLLKRMAGKEKFWQPHSRHAYQKAVRAGCSHSAVVREITALNAVLVLLAVLAATGVVPGLLALAAAYTLAALLMRRFALFPSL